ncbi:MAG: magnesium transporter [Betaproteobacteria bacterium RIFCSPLOWO2_12_FULL_63_13]|nr:MAG: magnesium transporter [Betaproteobacteria bacterium RIFCSPLOWO2_02_FULL_63_19]OGA51214.1 MAG: magnesium transporter [Betaproteobacteria bacterium RIFCSPLOWO2_12_FULL_63_13]
MAESAASTKELEDLQEDLREVRDLLRRHRLVEDLVSRQESAKQERVESPDQKRNAAELGAKLDRMHPADIAYILEALPREERLVVWDLVKADHDGEILLEVSDSVRESLIASMESHELVAAAEQLEADEIADLAPDLPDDVIQDVFQSLPLEEREQLRAAMSYPEDAVGALMDFDVVSVREDVTLEVVTRYLRRFDVLPDHTDQVFVVDRDEHLKGVLPLTKLIVAELDDQVGKVMVRETVTLYPDDKAHEAANAFERYDLVSAAVVDDKGRLVGRVTVDRVVDYIRERSESEARAQAGLSEEEDVFSSVWASVRNRWAWLAINLVTAFVASRVIGAFEGSIQKLVALAALMPIVAGIGGNAGNQTITMIVRSIALGQVRIEQAKKLFAKEIGVSMVNGLIWGGMLGVIAYLLYRSVPLGLVMTAAMTLNLVLAALMGVGIPLAMMRLGRDPAVGSSVLITAVTDSGGFFIFLGLATLFLL